MKTQQEVEKSLFKKYPKLKKALDKKDLEFEILKQRVQALENRLSCAWYQQHSGTPLHYHGSGAPCWNNPCNWC